jgi:hypothetical protein
MRFKQSRQYILLSFLIGLIVQLLLSFIAWSKDIIGNESFQRLLLIVLKIYSVHLAVILGSSFVPKLSSSKVSSKNGFLLAICLCLIYNLLLVTRVCIFTFSTEDDIDALISFLTDMALNASFLVAGVLSYYFSNEAAKK